LEAPQGSRATLNEDVKLFATEQAAVGFRDCATTTHQTVSKRKTANWDDAFLKTVISQ